MDTLEARTVADVINPVVTKVYSQLSTTEGGKMTNQTRLAIAVEAAERHIHHSEADYETRLSIMYILKAMRELLPPNDNEVIAHLICRTQKMKPGSPSS